MNCLRGRPTAKGPDRVIPIQQDVDVESGRLLLAWFAGVKGAGGYLEGVRRDPRDRYCVAGRSCRLSLDPADFDQLLMQSTLPSVGSVNSVAPSQPRIAVPFSKRSSSQWPTECLAWAQTFWKRFVVGVPVDLPVHASAHNHTK